MDYFSASKPLALVKHLPDLLAQPYPYYYKGKNLFYVALVIFLMTLIFNYLFEPFVVFRPEHKLSYFWISFIHSFNAFMVCLLVPGAFNVFINEDHWKVQNEILLITLILLLIGIGQFLVRDLIYDNPYNWTWEYFFEEIRNTFLAGILFVFILVPLNYMRLARGHLKIAESFNSGSKEVALSPTLQLTQIKTHQKSDDFELNLNSFLFAKAEGNYLELFFEDSPKLKSLKRMTLKELEVQLQVYPQFFKTHRSFLVNLQKVQQVKGNAQGYQLVLNDYPGGVPVSRGMISEFENKFKKT